MQNENYKTEKSMPSCLSLSGIYLDSHTFVMEYKVQDPSDLVNRNLPNKIYF